MTCPKPIFFSCRFIQASRPRSYCRSNGWIAICARCEHSQFNTILPSTSTFYKPASPPIASPAPAYSSFDPWGPSPFTTGSGFDNTKPAAATSDAPALTNGASSNFTGTGLPPGWWRKLEKVQVSIVGQQGFILNRYTVYQISSSVCILPLGPLDSDDMQRGSPVTRRYSEFVYLWEVLTRRYPFRLFPALPPKRIGRKWS